jgi:hypothetical protein
MIELAVVLAIRRVAEYDTTPPNVNEINVNSDDATQSTLESKNGKTAHCTITRDKITDVIDFASLLIFFFSYIAFNFIYITCNM